MGQVFTYLGLPPSGSALPQSKVAVPDLLGRSFADAALRVAQSGLLLAQSGSGQQIVAQSPAAGASVAPGTTVRVTLGGPKAPLGAPDLLGLTAQQVYAEATAAGYTVQVVGDGVSVHQSPAAGTPLQKGGKISVYLSPPP
jgi:beta-lactam-binding protein with PASTA domain